MNTKRIVFWLIFIIVIALIVWGLVAAMNKAPQLGKLLEPAPVSASDHARGPATAAATLIEYGDFQCPACGTFFPVVEGVWNTSSTSLRMVFRHFPLSQHANAIPAAIASEAASAQGKFWEMHDQLYEHQDDWGEVADAKPFFVKYATAIGLDMTRFAADMSNPATKANIDAEQAEGIHIGIDHTPTFFLNGKEISPTSYENFTALVQAAIAGTQ